MAFESDKYKRFTRRAMILGGINIALFSGLVTRMGYLQISQRERYKTLSDKNRIGHRFLPASRGEIVDRFGVPLALNNQNFQIFVVPDRVEDLDLLLKSLGTFVPISAKDYEIIKRDVKRSSRYKPVLIKDGLNWQQTAQLEFNMPNFPGIFIEEGERRTYPLSYSTAHIVGYVGRVNAKELTDDPIMQLPGFRIGKRGIEKKYDINLRGKVGAVETEVNSVGREVRVLNHTPSQTGARVSLTLDAELQNFCQKTLTKEKSAACVVMDVKTGAVYALCSHPSFDPNLFTTGISTKQWNSLIEDPAIPLTNKAVQGSYPPASTFKMITALAALEEGIIDKNTEFTCKGHHNVGRDRFHCWKLSGHGRVDLVKALAESCDVFFYEIANKLGIDKLAEMARRFGLGSQLGINLPGERSGLVPDKKWKKGRFGTRWQQGETIVSTIGQGYLLTTPLQLATMTARLVNGGYDVKPHLVSEVRETVRPKESPKHMGFSKAHLALIREGMKAVTMRKTGTAYDARIEDTNLAMGGKSGTAQVRRITRAQRLAGINNNNLPWKDRHHALFVSYAPIDNPRYACAVVVEHGGSGSAAAAPLARDILLEVQRRQPEKQRGTE